MLFVGKSGRPVSSGGRPEQGKFMYYGLQFNTSAGEAMQVVINTASLQVYARSTSGGVYGEWEYICGPGADGADGTLEADKAKVAETAYKLASPVQIRFTGDVVGETSFDGSQSVTVPLSLVGGGTGGADVSSLMDAVTQALNDKNSAVAKRVQKMIDATMNYHIQKSGWHVDPNHGGN